MKTKLFKQEGMGFQTTDLSDYYLTLNGKIYHTNPLTLRMLIIEGKGQGPLSYKNCHGIKLNNPNSNEWDVEIEMENILENGYKNQPANTIGFVAEHKSVPKLDANECLILKLVK